MECSQSANYEAAERAKKQRPGAAFGPLSVELIASDSKTVTFKTRGEDDGLHNYVVSINEVWLDCPSTVRNPGDTGTLMLSNIALQTLSDDNARTLIKDRNEIDIKWPDRAGSSRRRTAIKIWPTEIIVRGYAYGDTRYKGEISLLDAACCGSEQVFHLDSRNMVTLQVTRKGFAKFGLEDAHAIEELRSAVQFLAATPSKSSPGPRLDTYAKEVYEDWAHFIENGDLDEQTSRAAQDLLAQVEPDAVARSA